MNKQEMTSPQSPQIEIPIPEHAPEPVAPGSLPKINVTDDNQDGVLKKVHDFTDTDEMVPEKEQAGKASIIAPESGASFENNSCPNHKEVTYNGAADFLKKQKYLSDSEPLGFPPKYDIEGNGEDVN